MAATKKPDRGRRKKGFARASTLVQADIRRAGESRGFAVSRLLTHWAEVVGPDIARRARPVEVSYGRGFGATLTLLTTGAQAPMLEMDKDRIRDKVNACYGYAAISRVRITQTAPTGFAEGQAIFSPAPPPQTRPEPAVDPATRRMVADVADEGLRAALERLGANIHSRQDSSKGK